VTAGRRNRARGARSIVAAILLVVAAGLAGPALGQAAKVSAPAPSAPASAGPAVPAAHPAAPANAALPPGLDFAAAQQTLAQLDSQLPSVTKDDRLAAMGRQAAAIEASAVNVLAARNAELVRLNAAIRPLARRRRLTEAEQRQQAAYQAERAALLSQAAQAQALASQANRTVSLIAERRRVGFSARVLTPTASPLGPEFWTKLADAAGADLARFEALAVIAVSTALSAPEPRGIAGLAIGLVAALAVTVFLRRWLALQGWRVAARLPLGHAGRTLAIAWSALVDVGAVALGAGMLRLGLQWGGLLAPAANQLAQALVVAAVWGAAVLALGRAIATDERPDRRLLRVDDAGARRTGLALWAVAVITGAGFVLRRLNFIVGASVAMTIAANCIVSLAYAAAAGLLMVSFGRGGAGEQVRTPGRSLASLLLAGAILATVTAVLFGYTTLAALISGQVFWLSLITAVTYLVLRLIDDLCDAVFREHSRVAHLLSELFGLLVSTVMQIGLLLTAGLQLVIVLAAITLALTPFGQSGELLFTHARELGGAIQIGKATISPLGVAAGLATFALGLSLVHMARGWLERRYLPVTNWDAGVRNSVSTGVAYLGVAVAIACALAVTGLRFSQIALVASALSVGIGFGLQQVVQNFVAGIILLIERPVKVGDRVNVAGVEGDVLKIRVRATEIRTADRSTVIVPNSNLITSNVQNKSLGEPCVRVQLQVNVARSADVPRARDLIIQLAASKIEILKDPPPVIYIDSLAAAGGANLSLWFCIADPRAATRIKSDMYFGILSAFEQDKIAFL
jgi:potassium-dependent mechanosensitive channel